MIVNVLRNVGNDRRSLVLTALLAGLAVPACGTDGTDDGPGADVADDPEVGRPDVREDVSVPDADAGLPDVDAAADASDTADATDATDATDSGDGSGDTAGDATPDVTPDVPETDGDGGAEDVVPDTAPDVVIPPGCGDGITQRGEECDDGNDVDDDTCSNACVAARCGDGIINRTLGAEVFSGPLVTGPGGVTGYVCDDGSSCPEGSCDVSDIHRAPEHGICEALGFDFALTVSWGGGPGTGVAPMHHASNWDCFDFDCIAAATQSLAADCAAWEMLNTISCEGIVGEECDDGDANGEVADACRPDCTLPFCGDGITDSDEECDDGNAVDDDGCSNLCRLAGCGDGVRNGDEECDDGNDDDTDACRNSCVRPRCGDGFVSVYERNEIVTAPIVTNPFGATGHVCDDGGTCEGRSCSVDANPSAPEHGICQALGFDRATAVQWGGGPGEADNPMPHAYNWSCRDYVCGPSSNTYSGDNCSTGEMLNTITCFGGATEECDLGDDNRDEPDSPCRTDCRAPRCGDGITDTGEECDDGNRNETDGCSTLCRTPRCGDGVVQSGEQCDDGNDSDADFCLNSCRNPVCGDGIVSGSESCDDGVDNSTLPDAGCRPDCRAQRCGDGVRDTGETCDDGNADDRDLCTNLCELPVCGDGIRHTVLGEECDDGNAEPGDGCDQDCLREPGFATGHAVYIGHDYFARSAAVDRVVANAVRLADQGSTIQVLGYVQYADLSAGGEVANVNAAITSLAPTLGYTVNITTFNNSTALAGLIDAADVLLIYEPESTSSATMVSVGTAWSALLTDFVDRGGVVIVCDYSGESWALLNASGLLPITSSTTIGTENLTLPDPTDPMAEGVPNPYPATNGSRDIRLPADTTATVVAQTARGTAVVVRQDF